MESEPPQQSRGSVLLYSVQLCTAKRGTWVPSLNTWTLASTRWKKGDRKLSSFLAPSRLILKPILGEIPFYLWSLVYYFQLLQLVTTTICLQKFSKLTSRTICSRAALTELIFRKDCPVLLRDSTEVTRPAPLNKNWLHLMREILTGLF